MPTRSTEASSAGMPGTGGSSRKGQSGSHPSGEWMRTSLPAKKSACWIEECMVVKRWDCGIFHSIDPVS